MINDILQGMERGISDEVTRLIKKTGQSLRKQAFSLILQVVVFTAAAISLLLGFILLAANFVPVEYVLLVFGAALFLAFILLSK